MDEIPTQETSCQVEFLQMELKIEKSDLKWFTTSKCRICKSTNKLTRNFYVRFRFSMTSYIVLNNCLQFKLPPIDGAEIQKVLSCKILFKLNFYFKRTLAKQTTELYRHRLFSFQGSFFSFRVIESLCCTSVLQDPFFRNAWRYQAQIHIKHSSLLSLEAVRK